MPENLENVLAKKFQFGVEVLELSRYKSEQGDDVYRFEPFLADIIQDFGPEAKETDLGEVDTVVVPARKEGFEEVFLGEDRWYQIRIHGTMCPQIKHHLTQGLRYTTKAKLVNAKTLDDV